MYIGLVKPSEDELNAEQDARMRANYYDPIDQFPDKIDRLIAVIQRVCIFDL